MKRLSIIFLAILSISCNKSDTKSQTESLKDDLTTIHNHVCIVSNTIEGQLLNPSSNYKSADVKSNINDFTTSRSDEKSKIMALKASGVTSVVEYLPCADFEDMACFTDNWDISKKSTQTLKFDSSESYNSSHSLYFSSPYIAGAINLPGMEINGYADGIDSQTVYKVRWWAKYKGYTAKDNGPVMYMIVEQDGAWLSYKYVGVGDGSYVDEDWQMYSFQIITKSKSPLNIIFGTNLQDVWIDDIHLVKK